VSLKSNNQVASTLTITEFSEQHGKELIPASEVLDISITFVLLNKVTELIVVQKLHQLNEDVF
jgi:hypothetical protein